MILKINKKLVTVEEKPKEEKDFSPVYLVVTCVGYGLIFWLMDYTCSLFFSFHPFPFIHIVAGWLAWLGAWF